MSSKYVVEADKAFLIKTMIVFNAILCSFIIIKEKPINILQVVVYKLLLTFGGMGLLPCVAVARVFALVVRCRIMTLLQSSRVGKNRDTRGESPAGAGAGRTASHLAVLFCQKILAVRKGNDLYRPVMGRYFQSKNALLHHIWHFLTCFSHKCIN